ncbi:MAG: TolC family protein [Gemmatimonadaceae bacterium]
MITAFVSSLAFALLAVEVANDSVRPFPFSEFHRRVAENHPTVRQARLMESVADAEVQQARGAFDPVASLGWDRKRYGGSLYYDYLDAAIKIPTLLGADVTIGYERAHGQYIAPDRRTPGRGLFSAGISIPLGQRLLTDERRTALAGARALLEYAIAERTAIVNKLLLSSAKLYSAWYESHRKEALARSAVRLAEDRLRLTRARVGAGDAAAIDTVEAALELQRRRVLLQETDLELRNARLAVEGALWEEGGEPAQLPPNAVPTMEGLDPAPIDSSRLDRWLALAERNHPALRKAEAKLREGSANQRFAAQQRFVPTLDLTVAGIGAAADKLSSPTDALGTANDGKIGGDVKLPLTFRKERGKYAATTGKVDQLRLERDATRREIAVTVRAAANEVSALVALQQLQRVSLMHAQALRDGEARRFDAGESTLFLVNARERALIDEELKLISLEAKFAGARAALAVAVGAPAILPDA